MFASLTITVAVTVLCASEPIQVDNTHRFGVPSRMTNAVRPDKPHKYCNPSAGMTCPDGEFCRLPFGTCNEADAAGICRPIPDVCPAIAHPVCGCDGITYGNACEAHSAGASILHEGPCGDVCGLWIRVPVPPEVGCYPLDNHG